MHGSMLLAAMSVIPRPPEVQAKPGLAPGPVPRHLAWPRQHHLCDMRLYFRCHHHLPASCQPAAGVLQVQVQVLVPVPVRHVGHLWQQLSP